MVDGKAAQTLIGYHAAALRKLRKSHRVVDKALIHISDFRMTENLKRIARAKAERQSLEKGPG